MNKDKTPFLEMFPCCEPITDICGGLTNASVLKVAISRERLTMDVSVSFAIQITPAERSLLEQRLTEEYGLCSVSITSDNISAEPDIPAKPEGKKISAVSRGKTLYGKAARGKYSAIGELKADSGTVSVRGEVFAVDSRIIQKRDAAVLSFDITDFSGSVRVSKYIHDTTERAIIDKIKKGMYLSVRGRVGYNRYDEDITIDPSSIVLEKKPSREDNSEEKRVELHLHTRYSALDGLTDPETAVSLAARWGHGAVAITDHGVAQAFPEAWKAGRKHGIKVIFGLEGYYVNDLDERRAVYGQSDMPLDSEFVAFDLETTGLDSVNERITEIGAVVMNGEKAGARFQSFVNPGKPIPREITELTGITDRDVFDAPDESEVVREFLEFVAGRPLVAHNAPFDIGFIESVCERHGIQFSPVFLDTLPLSQCLLDNMRSHKLNMVAARLGLPEFNHHRAVDDANTVGRIMQKFFGMLKNEGAANISDIEAICRKKRGSKASGARVGHIVILVKNKTGLKNLYKLISLSHLEHFNKHPIIKKSLLQNYREGLIIGSACNSGEIFDSIVRGRSFSDLRRRAAFYDYLEIQPLCNNRFLIACDKAKDDEQLRDFNRRVVELAKALGKPVVATGDVHFAEPEHEIYRKILLASKKFADADKDLPLYFKTTDEMLEEFSYLGEDMAAEAVIKNPRYIAEQCEQIELLPKKLFTPVIENSASDLKALVYNSMREFYGENPPDIVKNRVETELSDIIGCNYDVIYMSAQKLVSRSLEAGYLVGSRGSVGSSIVAFLSGITEVNALPAHYRCEHCMYSDFSSGKDFGCGADMPDKDCPECGAALVKDGFDIPFETFLGFGGDKVPDIDLNFSGEYQARAHKHTEELFGSDHVFRAGTVGTIADRTAYGFVKKYLEERGLIVTKSEENRLTLGCVGIKRTTGQHPGGLVIIPQDMEVTDFCPVQHPADDKESGVVTTHFEYHSMEDNLLKLDELGHDDPTMIKMLEDFCDIDARRIKLDDKDTMQIFMSPLPLGLSDDDPIIGKTGTIGIPEFGTGFTRAMLVDTQPTKFDTLVKLSGFSHGTDVWLGNAKNLILSGTADISQTISCRDDIMLYLISMGMEEKTAFKIMESVRKGRGLTSDNEEEMRALLVPDWYIGSCQKIKYLFPKAHAVAYVMMAFRIAWFKVHRPLAFYAAYFYRRSQKDNFDASFMTRGIEHAKAKILEITKNPNPSQKEEDLLTTLEAVYEFYLRGFSFESLDLYQSDATRFIITENGLRPPFVTVSGLGEATALDLVRCREGNRLFVSVEELQSACTKLSQTNVEQLRALGALRDLPDTSQISFF